MTSTSKALFLGVGLGVFSWAWGQKALWEMRVCLEPANPPASEETGGGYEVRVAELLAEALQARPTYVWVPITPTNIRDYLRTGLCDLVMGVPEGFLRLTTTIPYYQIPHVFLYRQGTPTVVSSLEDSSLRQLKVTTYPLSQLDFALRTLGITPLLFRPPSILSQLDVAAPLVQAVLEGRADVAILSGSVGAYYARRYPDQLRLVPVTPELVELNPMFQMGTIGLRPGDLELRDLLNQAIAERWDAIQKVFQDMGIPLSPLPRPEVSREEISPLKVGVVLPLPTGYPALTDAAGRSAQLGATLAEDLLGAVTASRGLALKVLLASAPNPEAAQRAAERLVGVEKVVALVGGLGEGQAGVLGQVAERAKVPFLNIGDPDGGPGICSPYIFNVGASTAMYLSALAKALAQQGAQRWFLLYPASAQGRDLAAQARNAIQRWGGQVIGRLEVPLETRVFQGYIDQIDRADPDVLLSLLSPENQDFFLAQIGDTPLKRVASFPYATTQTRTYWLRMRQVARSPEWSYRPDLWEATLGGAARELNDQFASRTGTPMDPSAWAAYAAVKVVVDSALATGSTDPARLAAHMADPRTRFDLYKGVPLAFRPGDHQLLQPLYLVQVNPEAEPGIRLSQLQQLVRLVGQVPEIPPGEDPLAVLDQYAGPNPCR